MSGWGFCKTNNWYVFGRGFTVLCWRAGEVWSKFLPILTMALERRIFVLLDLMREVIISKSMIQNFVNIFLCHERELPDKVLRFSIHNTQRILDELDPFYGRTLTIFDSMQGHQLSRFKRLKVLRLMACQVNHFPMTLLISSIWGTQVCGGQR